MADIRMKPVDVVVVGSGVVGTIMSMELANAGLKVVCLERGRMVDPQKDFVMPYVQDELKFDRHSDIFQNLSRETITFRKSLELWQAFTVESRLIGHDDKATYMMHRAVVDGEVYAQMVVRARFLRRGGGVIPLEELFEALHRPDNLPELEPWVREWAAAAALPSTKAPAPSVWA